MTETKYEIDFLAVGDGATSGDAIAMRYGTDDELFINVTDGGSSQAGEDLVEHINKHYDNPDVIDNIICTHADDDHTSGLRKVLEEFKVENLWIHRPWLYAEELKSKFKGNWSTAGLEAELKECFPIVAEIEEMATDNGVKIHEPFQGARFGAFIVASPSKDFYLSLVPHFSRTPDPLETIEEEGFNFLKMLSEVKKSALDAVAKLVPDSWDIEILPGGETSPSNESSVVQFAQIGDRKILLTGDAGLEALDRVADFLEDQGYGCHGFDAIQIPHHGSKRNVSTDVLNKLVGGIVGSDSDTIGSAIASASAGESDHPRKRVLNAFTRRGYRVFTTEGVTTCTKYNFPTKSGWSSAEPHPFFDQVEDDEAA